MAKVWSKVLWAEFGHPNRYRMRLRRCGIDWTGQDELMAVINGENAVGIVGKRV